MNVLLVDDDEIDVMNAQRAFKKNNIINPLYIAHNGLEALAMLRGTTMPPERRLVLLDLNMPKMNGLEFLAVVRADAALKYLPIVILTTSADDRDKVEAYNFNVGGYILKPITFGAIVDTLAALHTYWSINEMP